MVQEPSKNAKNLPDDTNRKNIKNDTIASPVPETKLQNNNNSGLDLTEKGTNENVENNDTLPINNDKDKNEAIATPLKEVKDKSSLSNLSNNSDSYVSPDAVKMKDNNLSDKNKKPNDSKKGNSNNKN
jgi:hypothetical protein